MISEDDEEVQRHCDFADRWLEWNSEQEWQRTMSSWKTIEVMNIAYAAFIRIGKRKSEKTADELEEF